jgi:hypothetical protein
MQMMAIYQAIGGVAILVSLIGTWIAGRHKVGWLLCVISSAMWLPALFTGQQWAAVVNCCLSIAICVRNFTAGTGTEPQVERELQSA